MKRTTSMAATTKKDSLLQSTKSDETRPTNWKAIRIMFISLLMDLFSFTLILPLLPSLFDYYEKHDEGGLYSYLRLKVKHFQDVIGVPDQFNGVLFGGLLGSLFSFLQFVASPLIGALSDVYGRKPLLLLSLIGTAVAYALWSVSSTFALFVIFRIVGGISKGNVSISTAIVADALPVETRGRGMAMIGIAFSTGFLLGPITGAAFAYWARSQTGAFYIVPALIAFSLSAINVVFVSFCFEETLPKDKRSLTLGNGLSQAVNYINPSSIFAFSAVQNASQEDLKKMRRLGFVYFSYLFLYSGLEYTLTFLTHLRFQYTSVQQGKMFFFIGIIMAAVQGGFVRRMTPGKVKPLGVVGLALVVPSFVMIALAHTTLTMYSGLAVYAVSSAIVVPCLTTLISSYGSVDQKGTVMGIFRSLGALARALGPVFASLAFWSFGASASYLFGAVFLVIPVLMLQKIDV